MIPTYLPSQFWRSRAHTTKHMIRPWVSISKSEQPPKGREADFYSGNVSDRVTFDLILTLMSATGILQDSTLVIHEIEEY